MSKAVLSLDKPGLAGLKAVGREYRRLPEKFSVFECSALSFATIGPRILLESALDEDCGRLSDWSSTGFLGTAKPAGRLAVLS